MNAQTEETETRQRQPLPSGKTAAVFSLVGFILSLLLHGSAIFMLFKFSPSASADGSEQDIPVEIIVDASRSEPPVAPVSPESADASRSGEAEPSATPEITSAQQQNPDSGATTEPPTPVPDVVSEQASSLAKEEPSPPVVEPPQQPASVVASDEEADPAAPEPAPSSASSPSLVPPPPAVRPLPAQTASHRQEVELQKRRNSEVEAQKREEARARKDTETRRQAEARALATRERASTIASAPAPTHLNVAAAQVANSTDYRNAVMRHLAAFKRYPDGAREHDVGGRAVVGFTLDPGGRVVSARIVHSSGQATIDAETLAMVQRASPFPAPPQGAQRSFSAAIDFHLN